VQRDVNLAEAVGVAARDGKDAAGNSEVRSEGTAAPAGEIAIRATAVECAPNRRNTRRHYRQHRFAHPHRRQ